MGVEYCLVCIREGLRCGKGMELPRGRGRLSGVRETQLTLCSNQGNQVDYTDLIRCGHKTDDNGNAMFQIYLSKLFEKETG